MKNSASRSKLIESVRQWKESELGNFFYRADRVVSESAKVAAPWLPTVDGADIEESTSNVIRSCWMMESDVEGNFEDIAESTDVDSVAELVTALGGNDRVVEAVLSTLEQNEGQILMIAHEGAEDGYALAFFEGQYLIAGMELDEEIVDEGLISIAFLAQNADAPEAPLVPGFPMIESQNRMFETLNASVTLLNSLRENNGIDEEFIAIVEKFNTDLADVLGELSIDEGTLTGHETDFLLDMFEGVFAGISEEAANQLKDAE